MSVKSASITIIDNIINLIFIILAISVIVMGSALLFPEQALLICIALYILLRLKYGRSIPELNYILSFLTFIIIFYSLKFELLSVSFLGFYVAVIFLLLLGRFILDRDILKVYRHLLAISLGIMCVFFYLVSAALELNLYRIGYLIPLFCLLVFLLLPIFKLNPERTKRVGLTFAAVLICTGWVFLFRYMYSVHLMNKSLIEKTKGNIKAAIFNCERAISWMPFYDRYHYLLGEYYEAVGSEAEATSEYEKAINLGLRDRRTLANTYAKLAELHLAQKRWKDAHICLSKLSSLKSQDIISIMSIPMKNLYNSIMFEHEGRKEEAIGKLKDYLALDKYKNDHYSHYRLAKLYQACGEKDLAIYEYNKAIGRAPGEFMYRLDLAYLYFISHEVDRSIYQYSQALKIRPDSFDAMIGYINALLAGSCEADALLIVAELEKKYPHRVETHEILARVYRNNGFHEKALKEYKMVFKKTPVSPHTLKIMGDYYMGNCQYEKALKIYLKVLKLDPNSPIQEIVKMLQNTDYKEIMQRELLSIENRLSQSPQDTYFLRRYWFLKKKIESYNDREK